MKILLSVLIGLLGLASCCNRDSDVDIIVIYDSNYSIDPTQIKKINVYQLNKLQNDTVILGSVVFDSIPNQHIHEVIATVEDVKAEDGFWYLAQKINQNGDTSYYMDGENCIDFCRPINSEITYFIE